MSGSWERALDALEAEAHALAGVADDPRRQVAPAAVVETEGPIPGHLVPRAFAVQQAFDDAVAALRAASVLVQSELAVSSIRDDEPASRYIDTSA